MRAPAPLQPNPTAWQGALREITARLQRRHGLRWSWTTGGCFAFAAAFQDVFGGVRYGFCTRDPGSHDYPVQHAVVLLDDCFFDYSGVVAPPARLQRRKIWVKAKDAPGVIWFDDYALMPAERQRLRDILRASAVTA